MTQDRHRRRGWRGDERGQTLHDYVAGISVFILTVTLVIGLLPSVVAPYQAEGNAADVTKVSRISDRLVSNLSTASAPNVIDAGQFSQVMAKSDDELQTRYGLEDYQNVNISLVTLNGSAVVPDPTGPGSLAAGANDAGNTATATARIVSLSDPPAACRPACRLVVKIW